MDRKNLQEKTVLGLWDGHDAGAALVVDGQLVSAVSEERLTRIKRQGGFPIASIHEVLKLSGLKPQEVQHLAMAGTQGRLPARLLNQQYTNKKPADIDPLSTPSKIFSLYQNQLAAIPGLKQAEKIGSKAILKSRLRAMGFTKFSLDLVDHHQAHAATAAASLSQFKNPALIITMDGYGDGSSMSIWRFENRRLEKLEDDGARSSIALLYGALTRVLGFKEGEEGKLTGLAAMGNFETAQKLNIRRFLHHTQGRIQVQHRAALKALRIAKKNHFENADLAASLQMSMEAVIVEFIESKLKQYGLRRLAVAGGLFANVSLNGQIAAMGLDEFSVAPAMTDQGLCAGAAFVVSGFQHEESAPNIKLGTALKAAHSSPYEVAELLARGRFIGLARGPMEFGPRALTNRSILFDPRRPDLAELLQKKLNRSPFMPFAPILNAQRWDQVFSVDRHGIERATQEMTVALPTRKEFRNMAPVAVHVDGSARPQAIDILHDPWMVEVLEHFYAKTDCPALINTSFNVHREPIVCTREDAISSAKAIGLDALILGEELLHFDSPVPEMSYVEL